MIGFMEFFRLFDCLSEVRLSKGGINMFRNLMLQDITQLNRHTKCISMDSDFRTLVPNLEIMDPRKV